MPAPKWRLTLDVKDFYHDDDVPLEEKAEMMCTRLNARIVPDHRDFSYHEVYEAFEDLSLADSGELETSDFDEAMSMLYDWADAERVWVVTL